MKTTLQKITTIIQQTIVRVFNRNNKEAANGFDPAPSYWAMIPVPVQKQNVPKSDNISKMP
jgi:hypothetical protein